MRVETNKAWGAAVQLVSGNREALWALAGVFFVLPSFLFAVAHPQPETPPGATPAQLFAMLGEFYRQAWPLMLLSTVLQMLGSLTILTLFTDRARPTVGEAIGIGAKGLVPYLLTQVLLVLGSGVIAVVLGAAIGASGSPAVAVLIGCAALIAAIYVMVRTLLVAPVIAVEGARNPLAILQRSWQLTGGNVWRIALFLVLIGIAFGIVIGLFMLVVGLVLTLLAGGEIARIGSALVSSLLTAGATLYFIAVLAAIHRQLAGPSAEAVAEPFT